MRNSTMTLDDVCLFIEDCLHATAPTQAEGFPLIRTPNIGKGRLNLEGVHRISQDTYDKWTRRARPEPDDLILAREAPAGNVARIQEGQIVALGQRTVHLRPDKEQIDPSYLCYYLLTPRMQGALLAGETGATAKHVNMRDIRRLVLPMLHEREAQTKIGRAIAAYDDLIENNRRRIKLLEEAARLIYREWFVRLRFPGHELTKIEDGVPEGWALKPLSKVVVQIKQQVDPRKIDGQTRYIGLEHIPRRQITLNDWGKAEDVSSTKFRFEERDILFGKIRPYFHKVGFALEGGITSSDAIVIRPIESRTWAYALLLLSSESFVALASQTVREGSKMPRADWGFLQQQKFLVPPENLLDELESLIEPIALQLKNLSIQLSALSKARDLLLPRLMSGEIEL